MASCILRNREIDPELSGDLSRVEFESVNLETDTLVLKFSTIRRDLFLHRYLMMESAVSDHAIAFGVDPWLEL